LLKLLVAMAAVWVKVVADGACKAEGLLHSGEVMDVMK